MAKLSAGDVKSVGLTILKRDSEKLMREIEVAIIWLAVCANDDNSRWCRSVREGDVDVFDVDGDAFGLQMSAAVTMQKSEDGHASNNMLN